MLDAAKQSTPIGHRVRHEAVAIALTTLYFAMWLGVLMLVKTLILAEYQIEYHKFAAALIGALILAKVVLVMEHVPIGSWLARRPPAMGVAIRTLAYGLGVLVVLLVEKAFEARHESGGFIASLSNIFQHRDIPHVWVNTICVAAALLWFNVLSVFRRHVGGGSLLALFLNPPSEAPAGRHLSRLEQFHES